MIEVKNVCRTQFSISREKNISREYNYHWNYWKDFYLYRLGPLFHSINGCTVMITYLLYTYLDPYLLLLF